MDAGRRGGLAYAELKELVKPRRSNQVLEMEWEILK